MIKKELRPFGALEGGIYYDGKPLESLERRRSVSQIGFVMQDPSSQAVTDKVWHELAFVLESLGERNDTIRKKCAEISGYFGISDLYNKDTSSLSGGQKQLVCLASVMVLSPKLILLDEPTSQLDPVSAEQFISCLRRINEELGVSILITEHRLEQLFSYADKVVIMDKGRIISCAKPNLLCAAPRSSEALRCMYGALPASVRLFHALEGTGDCPVNVRQGRDFITRNYKNTVRALPCSKSEEDENRSCAVSITKGYFRYERETPDVLKALDLKAYFGEFLCLMGANGSGKTTLLRIISGIRRLYKGKIRFSENRKSIKVSMLAQDVRSLFTANTVKEELEHTCLMLDLPKACISEKVSSVLHCLELEEVKECHPFDLSGGEMQKLAFAKIMLISPDIILLDEPTKGLDPFAKEEIANIISDFTRQGKCVIAVTHDIEFAASHAHRCAMFFDGNIVSEGKSDAFFAENDYYTTASARMSRNYYDGCVKCESLIELCRLNGRKEDNDGI